MKTQKGITLIALIITIIVMLILVGVSVSVALNTGLFKTAQGVAKNTEAARVNETKLSEGKVTVGDAEYESLEAYVKGELPTTALKRGNYVSYEQKFGNGTPKITTWRVLSNENGTVKLLGKLSGVNLPDIDSFNPVTKYGAESLIGNVTIPNFEEILTALVGANNTITANEGVDNDGDGLRYPALSEEETSALNEFGIGAVMYYNISISFSDETSTNYQLQEIDVRDDKTVIDMWRTNMWTTTEDGYPCTIYVFTQIATGTEIKGGQGTASSPYVLVKQ